VLPLSVMPDGYAVDRSDEGGRTTTKTFCNYRRPVKKNAEVTQDYIKGAGLGTSLLIAGIRQYDSPADARREFASLVTVMRTCRRDTDTDGAR
jgi:hypothetical protein